MAARQYGVLSVADLLACGLNADSISVRARNGRLHPMHRTVYAVGHANPPREAWLLAAVKACGLQAVLSHLSAGAHERLIEWEDR